MHSFVGADTRNEFDEYVSCGLMTDRCMTIIQKIEAAYLLFEKYRISMPFKKY